MRALVPTAFLFAAIAFPGLGNAQVYQHETPPPTVNATRSAWQLAGEPLFHAGSYYYPAGATVFFDGRVMARTGTFEGVPLYEDVTLEPYSIVYVPVGGAVMRPYERRREGQLAGTVGSRTPSFPIQRDVELSALSGYLGLQTPAIDGLPRYAAERGGSQMVQIPLSAWEQMVEELRTLQAGAPAASAPPAAPAAAPAGQPTGIESVPRPESNAGIWIDFNGERWYSTGQAVDYDANRFDPAGSYRGFPVYRERGGAGGRIFVTVVQDGPVAPFERR